MNQRMLAFFLPVPLLCGLLVAHTQRAAAEDDKQTVLGPGLYMFQTRVDSASCGDAERTGYVTSFYAAVNGIPANRKMDMKLLNSSYWSSWTLTITPEGKLIGDSLQDNVTGPGRGNSHFEATLDKRRWKGKGARSYNSKVNGQTQRCSITYDALLTRIDS